jgi:hypothetical protein
LKGVLGNEHTCCTLTVLPFDVLPKPLFDDIHFHGDIHSWTQNSHTAALLDVILTHPSCQDECND